MSFFALKISDPNSVDLVNSIKAGSDDIIVQQLNQLEGDLIVGEKVFIQLGGDKVSWEKGLIGLSEITTSPFDKGYDEKNARNFKLGLKMILVLKDVIKREEFRFYVDAYDAGGIGPNTKGEQNQAIKTLANKQAYAILRAMVERQPDIEEQIRTIFQADEYNQIFGKMSCMVERYMTYKETLQYREQLKNIDEFEEENKGNFKEWLRKQVKPKGTVGAGEPYGSVDPYVSTLAGIKVDISGVEHSIFATTSIATVSSLEELSTKNHANQTAHNRKSSAIKLYIKYLQDSGLENEEQVSRNDYIDIKFETGIDISDERNRIVFGAPGTGKSFLIKDECEKMMDNWNGTYERVTFHPDYSYSQFVGSYKPVMKGNEISYSFVPGPFIRVLVEALKSGRSQNPKPHVLIIEEINRSKVAAVFGDVFQLLDRGDVGVSVYDIQTSEDIKNYLARPDVLGGDPSKYDRLKIPDNMFIWATMNSADQGVFPMDTAFKRRWEFEYLGINDGEADMKNGTVILGKGEHELEINWNQLRKTINERLASNDFKVNEDKLIGPFFLSEKVTDSDDSGTIANPEEFIKAFKNKVIMYLYEDAAKQHKHKLFSGCDSTKYSAVCEAFDEKGIDIFGDGFRELYNQQEG